MDSKATLASANGLYEKFLYFSYESMPGEAIDADAAHKIAQAIGVSHQIDKISDIDSDFENIDVIRSIIYHNYGRIGNQNANDIRKRAYYQKHPYFDVEVNHGYPKLDVQITIKNLDSVKCLNLYLRDK